MPPQGSTTLTPAFLGGIAAVGAFGLWGLILVYFKAIDAVPAVEIIAHRVVWSALLLALVLLAARRWRAVQAAVLDRRLMRTLTASAGLIGVNWTIFVWAVNNDRVLETSLGYFINPLVNVLLGVVFLKERLRPGQWLAAALAAGGVGNLLIGYGALLWVAIALPVTFGLYGLLRKIARVDATTGLLVETTILSPIAVVYLAWLAASGGGAFLCAGPTIDLLLLASGPVTAVPMMCFAAAARRLKLSTLGFFQYLAPTLTFLLGVFVYHEPFDPARQLTFALIWLALAIYSVDSMIAGRARRRGP